MSSVGFERDGTVAVIQIERPEVRNAVDRETAAALADAFRRFEEDEELRCAVLTGAGGTFCAGADLKAIGEERGNRAGRDGDGPMGPTRMLLSKPVVDGIGVAYIGHLLSAE